MCSPEWEIVRIATAAQAPRLGAKLPDGRIVDLQAAHVALRGSTSPHFRDATSYRLSAAYGNDLVRELLRACPREAVVS